MSHTAEVELYVTDLDILEEAAKMIGTELVRNQKKFHSYNDEKCEHAIRVTGNSQAYEMGVVKRADGKPGYVLRMDSFVGGHGLIAAVGEGACKLNQAYTVAMGCRHYRRKGYSVRTETKNDGRILVKARR